MLNDYEAGKFLTKQFPNRIRFIRYEDLIYHNSVSVIEDLYKFVGFEKRHSEPTITNTVSDWVKLLDRRFLELVDIECDGVYQVLGYKKVNNPESIDNKNVSFIPNFDINK